MTTPARLRLDREFLNHNFSKEISFFIASGSSWAGVKKTAWRASKSCSEREHQNKAETVPERSKKKKKNMLVCQSTRQIIGALVFCKVAMS